VFPKDLQPKQLSIAYQMAYNAWIEASGIAPLFERIVTDSEVTDLSDVGDVPLIKRIDGDFFVNSLASYGFTVRTNKYGAALQFDRHEFEQNRNRDTVNKAINKLAMRQADHIASNLLLETTLPGLATAVCLDGQPFFSANHPIIGGVQSNTTTGTAVATLTPTAAEADAIFTKLKLLLKKMRSDTNGYHNPTVNQFFIFCPLEWEDPFNRLFGQGISVSSGGNIVFPYNNQGMNVKVIAAPHLVATSGTCPIYLGVAGPGITAPLATLIYVEPHTHEQNDGLNERTIFASSGRYEIHPYRYNSMARCIVSNA
jgi:hypothetical protein